MSFNLFNSLGKIFKKIITSLRRFFDVVGLDSTV